MERNAALLLEAFVLHGLAHPRIVALVAVATHVRPIMILMEHMQGGDLRTYLRRSDILLHNPPFSSAPPHGTQCTRRS